MIALKCLTAAFICTVIIVSGTSCKTGNGLFGPKYGCPTNGKAFGAERILSGEKPPKTKKFKP